MPTLTHGETVAEEMQTAPAMTLELLHRAIDNVNPANPDGIPFSDGMRWIWNNREAFLDLLQTSGVLVEDFFSPHFGNSHIGSVLQMSEVLRSLDDYSRAKFVRDVFLSVGSCDCRWVETARKCDVTKDALAEMILAKLKQSSVDLDGKYRVVNFIQDDFILHGAGGVEVLWNGTRRFESIRATYWSVLSNDQLSEAMWTVIDKDPRLLFGAAWDGLDLADRLMIRLGEEQTLSLLEAAALQVKNLRHTSTEALSKLPLHVQEGLAGLLMEDGETVPCIWVAKMALRMNPEGARKLLNRFGSTFQGNLGEYRQWCGRLSLQTGLNRAVVSKIEQLMRAGLKRVGCRVAELNENTHNGNRQLAVRLNGVLYVMDRDQVTYQTIAGHTVCPRKGDLVAFFPASARSIHAAGRVKVATFTLLRSNR